MSIDSQKPLPPPSIEIIDHNHDNFAQATAFFYPAMIDTILSGGSPAEKDRQFLSIAESLPPHLKPLYLKGFAFFKSEAEKNRLQYEKEENVGMTLYNYLLQQKLAQNVAGCEPLLKPQEGGKIIRVAVPYPGIPVLFLRDDIFKTFSPTATARYVFGNNLGISFIYVPGSLQDEKGNTRTFRHEVHHAVWDLLGKSGFIRPSDETDPETKNSFNLTRNELAAYLLGDETKPLAAHVCYSENPEIIKKAQSAIDSLIVVSASLHLENSDPKILLYSIMKSRNYDELVNNICHEYPFSQTSSLLDNLTDFYRNWQFYKSLGDDLGHVFANVLRQRKIAFTPEDARQFIIIQIAKGKPTSPDQVLQSFEHRTGCKQFLSEITGENSIILNPSTISEIIKESTA